MSGATTIRRGAPSARKAAAAQGTARKVRKAKAAGDGLFARAFGAIPLAAGQLHRIMVAMFLVIAAVLAWIAASAVGLPQLAAARIAQAAGDAGFSVRRVEVRGVHNMNELTVYERVLGQKQRAMTEVDVGALRGELLRLPWVADARVSRQLPDTLVVDIVERSPAAVLRGADGQLRLVDAGGRVLQPVAPDHAGHRLVISGPGVEQRIDDVGRLLAAVPAMRGHVREADWIGNRRWNFTFRSGQVLMLPEGEDAQAHALAAFAKLDSTNRVLGGRVAAFDMRAPDRIYLRVPGNAAQIAALAAAEKKRAQQENP